MLGWYFHAWSCFVCLVSFPGFFFAHCCYSVLTPHLHRVHCYQQLTFLQGLPRVGHHAKEFPWHNCIKTSQMSQWSWRYYYSHFTDVVTDSERRGDLPTDALPVDGRAEVWIQADPVAFTVTQNCRNCKPVACESNLACRYILFGPRSTLKKHWNKLPVFKNWEPAH